MSNVLPKPVVILILLFLCNVNLIDFFSRFLKLMQFFLFLFIGGWKGGVVTMLLFFPTKIRIKTDLGGYLFLCRYLFEVLLGGGDTYILVCKGF